jgi:hypothetical protein
MNTTIITPMIAKISIWCGAIGLPSALRASGLIRAWGGPARSWMRRAGVPI